MENNNHNQHIQNFKDFGLDITKNSAQIISESFNSTNYNGTTSFLFGAGACGLCIKLVKYNVVPIVTLGACTICTAYVGSASYKAVKEFIKDPTKGLP